jgi:hypothetical protein
MKTFVVAVFCPTVRGTYASTMFTVEADTAHLAVNSFWTLEGGGTYENEEFEGFVTVYDLEMKRVVYRYGCER